MTVQKLVHEENKYPNRELDGNEWIEYLKQNENQSSRFSRPENNKTIQDTTNAISSPTKTPSRKMTKGETWTMIAAVVGIIGVIIALFIAYRQGIFDFKEHN